MFCPIRATILAKFEVATEQCQSDVIELVHEMLAPELVQALKTIDSWNNECRMTGIPMRRVIKFLFLSFPQQRLLIEAIILTGLSRAAVRILPFRWIAWPLGEHMSSTPDEPDASHEAILQRVKWAVGTASQHVPWNANCLAQAIAATLMLRLRRVAGTIYFGVMKDDQGEHQAHAWLRSGETIVTGARGMQTYTVVSTFAFPRWSTKHGCKQAPSASDVRRQGR